MAVTLHMFKPRGWYPVLSVGWAGRCRGWSSRGMPDSSPLNPKSRVQCQLRHTQVHAPHPLLFILPVFCHAGSHGDTLERNSPHPGPCSLSQGNTSSNQPRWQVSRKELDSDTLGVPRTQISAASAECRPHMPVSRLCSRRRPPECAPLHPNVSQDLASSELDTAWQRGRSPAQPQYQSRGESVRPSQRPPPPYPGAGKSVSASAHQPKMPPPLWRPLRSAEGPPTALGGKGCQPPQREHQAAQPRRSSAYPTPASDPNSKTLGNPNWLDWQRERWQIWELLSTDNPDALPETLV